MQLPPPFLQLHNTTYCLLLVWEVISLRIAFKRYVQCSVIRDFYYLCNIYNHNTLY